MPRLAPRTLRWHHAALLMAALLALLAAAALAINPLMTARARHRLTERFGDVRAVALSGGPLAWLTGAPIRVDVRLGHAKLDGGGLGGVPHRVDEINLTADSLQTGRLRLETVRVVRRGNRTTAHAIVPAQSIRLAGRSVRIVPASEGGALVLRPEALPLVPKIRIDAAPVGGMQAVVVGGPLSGRRIPLGGSRSRGAGRGQVEELSATSVASGVALTAVLTREDA